MYRDLTRRWPCTSATAREAVKPDDKAAIFGPRP